MSISSSAPSPRRSPMATPRTPIRSPSGWSCMSQATASPGLRSRPRAIGEGHYAAARVQLSAGDAGKARDVTSTLLTAWTYAGAGELRHALDMVDRIRDPSMSVFRDYHAGLMADALGNSIEAQRRLKPAYAADKNTLRLADAYARFLARHNDPEGAKKIYEDFSRLIPNHPMIVAALWRPSGGPSARAGGAQCKRRRGRGALRPGQRRHASGRRTRGADLFAPGPDFCVPITIWRLSPSPTCLRTSSRTTRRSTPIARSPSPRRCTRARKFKRRSNSTQPGDKDEAMTRMKAIVAAHPNDPDAWSALGSLQRSAKNFEDAAKSYDKAIELVGTPDRAHWTLFYFRGISLRALEAMAEGGSGFQEGAGALSRPAARAQLSRLFLGRSGHQSRRGVQDVAPGGRSEANRRLHRRQPRLGAFQARAFYARRRRSWKRRSS